MSTATTALPLPTADPGAVGRYADALAHAAAQLGQTAVARVARDAFGLSRVWAGPAADAAREEALAVTALVEPLGAALARTGPALHAYAAALETAGATIRALREEWGAGESRWRIARHAVESSADLAAAVAHAQARAAEAEWVGLARELTARHTRAMATVDAAAATATVAVAEVLAVLPGGDVHGADVHDELLLRLPMTAAAERREAAQAWLAGLAAAAGRPIDHWEAADLARVSTADLADPERARAFVAALAPGQLERLTATMSVVLAAPHGLEPGRPVDPEAGRLDTLAVAFVTALDPRTDSGLDAATAAAVASWRAGWVRRLMAYGAGAAGGGRLSGFDAQGVLLRAGARVAPERCPGPGYAASAAAGMVAVERARTAAPTGVLPGALGGPVPLDLRRDPLADLLHSLRGDPAAARAALLASTADGATVAEYLLHERLLATPGWHVGASTELAEVLPRAATGADPQAVRLAAVVLDSAGATAQTTLETPRLALSLDAELGPLRGVLADLLAAHAETWDAWSMDAATRERLATVPAVELVGGHPPDLPLVLLRSPERFDALLGELARDGLPAGDPVAPGGRAPALSRLLDRVLDDGSQRVVAALSPPVGTAPDLAAAEAAARRTGEVVGSAVAAGTISVITAAGARDEANAGINEILDYAIGKARVPGAIGAAAAGSGWGWALALAENAAKGQVESLVREALPTDSADRARSASASQEAGLLTELRAVGTAAVVQAQAWSPDLAPAAWCARRATCTPFWGADGRPLPPAVLSLPQLSSAQAWASEVVATSDVPEELVRSAEEAINRLRPPRR